MEGDFDSQFFNKLVNSFKIAFGSPLLQKCVAVNRKRKILNIFVLYFCSLGIILFTKLIIQGAVFKTFCNSYQRKRIQQHFRSFGKITASFRNGLILSTLWSNIFRVCSHDKF